MKVDDEKMGWIENAGIQNLNERSYNTDIIRKQASISLSVALYLSVKNKLCLQA